MSKALLIILSFSFLGKIHLFFIQIKKSTKHKLPFLCLLITIFEILKLKVQQILYISNRQQQLEKEVYFKALV